MPGRSSVFPENLAPQSPWSEECLQPVAFVLLLHYEANGSGSQNRITVTYAGPIVSDIRHAWDHLP